MGVPSGHGRGALGTRLPERLRGAGWRPPVPAGAEVAENLNELAASDRFEFVVATRDWHPPDHASFQEHGGPWPKHCVKGTEGAELHPSLDLERVDLVFDAGQEPHLDGYSAFERPELGDILRERGIDSVYVAGLATNICVRGTALGALEEDFSVTVDPTASRGLEVEGVASIAETFKVLEQAGATVVS